MPVRVASPDDLAACFAIRHEVFVVGQQVAPEIEVDGEDPVCIHFVAFDVDRPVGTARLRFTADGHAKAERVAVLASVRGRHFGVELMQALEAEARRQGFDEVVLNAQVQVVPFYEALGYGGEGGVFEEAAIPHRKMRKKLQRGDPSS